MATIPVERTGGGIPWWVWLLGLLALLGIGLLLFSGDDDDVVQPAIMDEQIIDETPDADPALILIEDQDALALAVDDLDTAEGQTVNLRQAEVLRVVGDSSFVIGTPGRETLVILSGLGESETGAGGSDGRFNIDQGDRVTITGGALSRYLDNMPGTSDLTPAERNKAREQRGVITVREASNIVVEG